MTKHTVLVVMAILLSPLTYASNPINIEHERLAETFNKKNQLEISSYPFEQKLPKQMTRLAVNLLYVILF